MAKQAYVFDAQLDHLRGVRRTVAVRADQSLADLHRALQEAFGWSDDHLYAFWLSGEFFAHDGSEYAPLVDGFKPGRFTRAIKSAETALADLELEIVSRSPTCSTSVTSGACASCCASSLRTTGARIRGWSRGSARLRGGATTHGRRDARTACDEHPRSVQARRRQKTTSGTNHVWSRTERLPVGGQGWRRKSIAFPQLRLEPWGSFNFFGG